MGQLVLYYLVGRLGRLGLRGHLVDLLVQNHRLVRLLYYLLQLDLLRQ